MNDQPVTTDEQDDAAFRARLAPLASEVLPSPPRAEPRSPGRRRTAMFPARLAPSAPEVLRPPPRPEPRSLWRRGAAIALAAIVVAAVLLGIAWRQSNWPWSAVSDPARVAARGDPAVTDAPRSAAPKQPAIQDAGRTAVRTDSAAPPPAQAQTSSEVQTSSEAMVGLLVRRGDAALADGDIIGARLLFERAAALGSAAAATAAGKTYDIEFLLRSGARGIRANQAAATAWFRKAAALGDPEARSRLARIEAQTRP